MFEKYLHFKSWLFFQSSELVEKVIFLLNQLVSMPQVIKSYILFSSLTKSVGDEAKCRGKSFFSNQQWPMKITTIWTWGSLSLSFSTHMHAYIDALGFIFVLICISMRSVWLLIKDELEKEIKTFKCSMVLYLRKKVT